MILKNKSFYQKFVDWWNDFKKDKPLITGSAKICGISIRTVETQRYRLSKLLKLDKNENLNSYIHKIN